jgi:FAD/FMN-containing dehydrogenase
MRPSYRNNLIWHTDAKNRSKVDAYNEKCLTIMRGLDTSEWANYQNATRSGPIELRFRGKERIARLQQLKRKWDPTAIFANQLLV